MKRKDDCCLSTYNIQAFIHHTEAVWALYSTYSTLV